jgi:hypothetical protein
MKKIKCVKCKKIIEGYTDKQLAYLLMQHDLSKHNKKLKKWRKKWHKK